MTTLSKDEVVKMAQEAGAAPEDGVSGFWVAQTEDLQRFTTLCRADLVAEVERLKADLRTERDDWKARALKAEQAGEPVLWQYRWTNPSGDPYQESQTDWKQVEPTWNQTVQQKCDELLAYRFGGKPTYEVRGLYATPPQPAAQEPTSAVPVVRQMVEALNRHHTEATRYSAAKSKANATCAEFKTNPLSELIEQGYMLSRGTETVAALAAGRQYLKENGK